MTVSPDGSLALLEFAVKASSPRAISSSWRLVSSSCRSLALASFVSRLMFLLIPSSMPGRLSALETRGWQLRSRVAFASLVFARGTKPLLALSLSISASFNTSPSAVERQTDMTSSPSFRKRSIWLSSPVFSLPCFSNMAAFSATDMLPVALFISMSLPVIPAGFPLFWLFGSLADSWLSTSIVLLIDGDTELLPRECSI